MSIPNEAIYRLALVTQPMVFETGNNDYPYSVQGTAFLVGYRKNIYALTARHVLQPSNLFPVCLFPSDTSQRIIPLNEAFFVPEHQAPDDFMDLAVLIVDDPVQFHEDIKKASILSLSRSRTNWGLLPKETEYYLIGFPDEKCSVDYKAEELNTQREILAGHYEGPSSIPYLHKLRISSPHKFTTFSGFSGGPVFCIEQAPENDTVRFCGMALRGSVSSGVVHFLDKCVLLDALEVQDEIN